jgi:hypothetical protein
LIVPRRKISGVMNGSDTHLDGILELWNGSYTLVGQPVLAGFDLTATDRPGARIAARGFIAACIFALANDGLGQAAAAQSCPGPMRPPQHHPMGAFDFDTSSWIAQQGNYKYYSDCVHNNKNSSFPIFWYSSSFIANWIYKGATVSNPRTSRFDAAHTDFFSSCVAVGGAGRPTEAYIVDSHPQSDMVVTINPNCVFPSSSSAGSTPAQPQPTPGGAASNTSSDTIPQDATFDLSGFFPSDASNPDETMLAFFAKAQFLKATKSEYLQGLNYYVKRTPDGQKANLTVVRVSLSFREGQSEVATAFAGVSKEKDGSIPPAKPPTAESSDMEGYVEFGVKSDHGWHLDSAFLRFTDRDNRQLATVLLPILVPGQ